MTQTNNEFVSAGSVDIGVGSTTGGAAVATYTMTSGTLTVGTTMIVGGSSTTLAIGTFNQTGGYLQAKTLILGAGTGSTGVANISGTGSVQLGVVTVNPASTLQVGTSGSGTFNLCSLASGTSTLSVGTIQVGSVSSSATTEVDSQFLMGNATDPNSLPAVTAGTIDFGQTDNSPLTSRLFSMASGTLTAGLVDLTSYDGGRTCRTISDVSTTRRHRNNRLDDFRRRRLPGWRREHRSGGYQQRSSHREPPGHGRASIRRHDNVCRRRNNRCAGTPTMNAPWSTTRRVRSCRRRQW